jgi:hypothetical protein
MNRRSLLQALALTPLAVIFPFLRTTRATCEKCRAIDSRECVRSHGGWHEGDLHIFVSDGDDIVIARDERDAVRVFAENTGPWPDSALDFHLPVTDDEWAASDMRRLDYDNPGLHAETWIQWDDDGPFEMLVDEYPDGDFPKLTIAGPLGGVVVLQQTYQNGITTNSAIALPRWWIARNGRGYLASRA